jgi:HSP20 family protein
MHEQDLIRKPGMAPPIPIKTSGLSVEAKEMLELIAKRAYEIFESKGRGKGRDLENWLQAEAELCRPMPIDVKVSPEGLIVRAEVAGFTPRELEIALEPRRLTIVGKRHTQAKRKTERGISSRKRTTRLLRTLQLPIEIDTHHATARLKRGILEIDAQKALVAESKSSQVGSNGTGNKEGHNRRMDPQVWSKLRATKVRDDNKPRFRSIHF